MVKTGAVVIDVGINRLPNGKICGDVDFEGVKHKASYITPGAGRRRADDRNDAAGEYDRRERAAGLPTRSLAPAAA